MYDNGTGIPAPETRKMGGLGADVCINSIALMPPASRVTWTLVWPASVEKA